MKKCLIIIGIFILCFLIFLFSKGREEIVTIYNCKEVAELLKPVYSEYDMGVEMEGDSVIFSDSVGNYVDYDFFENKIDYISIHYNLEDNNLDSSEVIENIEELYRLVTDNLIVIKDYFADDFLLRNEYFIGERDKEHIKDLLDFKEECSGWEVRYRYKRDQKYAYIQYSLDARYDNEGFYQFGILIS